MKHLPRKSRTKKNADNPLQRIAGVDEVGRGPLAGPVVAAAVILDPQQKIDGLVDSKKLSAKKRTVLSGEIKEKAIAWAIGSASEVEIDAINILQATFLAMQRAVAALSVSPLQVLVDGNQCPKLSCPVEAIIKGDGKIPAISAASIVAKVHRDELLTQLDKDYPGYGFAQHKGYPTKHHIEAIKTRGVTRVHRRSFAPVKQYLTGERLIGNRVG